MTAALREEQKKQEKELTGITEEKDREETELEDAAHAMAQALVLYFNDTQQESEAGEIDLTESDWRKLSDHKLLQKSQRVIDLATALSTGPQATTALKYGITAANIAALTKERADYDQIINAPGVAASVRAALTKGFGPAFSLVEKKFKELDKLIIQFGKNAEGRGLIAAWKDARVKKGANAPDDEEETPPAPPTPAPTPA